MHLILLSSLILLDELTRVVAPGKISPYNTNPWQQAGAKLYQGQCSWEILNLSWKILEAVLKYQRSSLSTFEVVLKGL